MDRRTTINTPLEDVLKRDLMLSIYVESDKIAGLKNLGRTFFINETDIKKADDYAQAQMVQKYGDEVYGKSAQLSGQHSNGTTSQTGTSSGTAGSLIHCSVSRISNRINEAGGDFTKFKRAMSDFVKYLDRMSMDSNWVKKHPGIDQMKKAISDMREGNGPADEVNKKNMEAIVKTLESDAWKAELNSEGNELNKLAKSLNDGWVEWGGQKDIGKAVANDKGGDGKIGDGKYAKGWFPELSYRIDVRTSFDENWYKRKYKSGLINAAIRAIKTDARSHSSPDVKTQWTNHKYTYDEMLPQEKKQLDGLQWTMTNKVARDYITFLLGWTRDKVLNEEKMPKEELQVNEKFGKKMADAALGDRGILGRLKQKLFAGGQSNNVVTVAFQMADPNDGWEVEEGKEGKEGEKPEEPGEEGKETAPGEGDKPTEPGKEGSDSEPTSIEGRIERIEKTMDEHGLWKESIDPQRKKLVLSACNGEDVGKLVDSCIFGK